MTGLIQEKWQKHIDKKADSVGLTESVARQNL